MSFVKRFTGKSLKWMQIVSILAPVPSEQFFVLILTGISHRTGGRDAGEARTVEFPEEG
jgi:hypothetical protein